MENKIQKGIIISYNFYQPARVLFRQGRINESGKNIKNLNLGRKTAVVISNGKSTRTNSCLNKILEQLTKAGIETVIHTNKQGE